MPKHAYACAVCGLEHDFYTPITESPPPHRLCTCGEPAYRRFYPPSIMTSMPEHFSHATGGYVSNRRQFLDGLKRGSEEASIRTGTDVNYVEVDPGDKAALGVTDEGLDATHRVHRSIGLTTGKLYL